MKHKILTLMLLCALGAAAQPSLYLPLRQPQPEVPLVAPAAERRAPRQRLPEEQRLLGLKTIEADSYAGAGLVDMPLLAGDVTAWQYVWEAGRSLSSGAFYDGMLAAMFYLNQWDAVIYANNYIYDPASAEPLLSYTAREQYQCYSAMGDPETGVIYGEYWLWRDKKVYWGTYNPFTGHWTPICEMQLRFTGVCCDADGNYYAITDDGMLYSVDKLTGATTPLTATEARSGYAGAMCVEEATGAIFYATSWDIGSALYTIDPDTGYTSFLYALPGSSSVATLFFEPQQRAGVPARVDALTAVGSTSNSNIDIRFTLPVADERNAALQGTLQYTVTANGVAVKSGSAAPGSAVTCTATMAGDGPVLVRVTATNAAGRSLAQSASAIAGYDRPQAPRLMKIADEGDGRVKLQFLPTEDEGENGAPINPLTAQYVVTRYPDGTELTLTDLPYVGRETYLEYTDAYTPAQYEQVWYEVRARANGRLSTYSTASNALGLGNIVPPFADDFPPERFLLGYTSLMGPEAENQEWNMYDYLGESQWVHAGNGYPLDTWLVLPPLQLQGGEAYRFDFTGGVYSLTAGGVQLSAWLGDALSVDALTTPVIAPVDIATNYRDGGELLTGTFLAPADGIYYLGIHAYGEPYVSAGVSSIRISAPSPAGAPRQVEQMTVTPAADTSLSAVITATAPTHDNAGAPLSGTLTYRLMCGEHQVGQGTILPGAAISVTDNAATHGSNTYALTTANAAGTSLAAQRSAFVGYDRPVGRIAGITLTEPRTNVVRLQWQPVTHDANGLAYQAGQVQYRVVRVQGGVQTLLAEATTATTLDDTTISVSGDQTFVRYAIQARNDMGDGTETPSEWYAMGDAWTTPYSESFSNGATAHGMMSSAETGNTAFAITDDSRFTDLGSADADNGYIMYSPGAPGESARLHLGKIDLSGATAPWLAFDHINFPQGTNTVAVLISDGSGYTEVAEVLCASSTPWWSTAFVDLTPWQGRTVQLTLEGRAKGNPFVMLDNIRIGNLPQYDICNVEVSVQSDIAETGRPLTLAVTLQNGGSQSVGSYYVELSRPGLDPVIIDGNEPLAPMGVTTLTYDDVLPPMSGAVTYRAAASSLFDSVEYNNASGTLTVEPMAPAWPQVRDLTATADDGAVLLRWTPLDADALPGEAVRESFEDARAGDRTVDGWNIVDADGHELGLAAAADPQQAWGWEQLTAAWFVTDNSIGAYTHSGNNAAASMMSAAGAPVSDWLITPPLDGTAQPVRFYASAFTNYFAQEQLEIHVSYAGNDPADFTPLGGISDIPEQAWGEYVIDLPEGVRHMAIVNPLGAYLLLVDDVIYIPDGAAASSLTLTGYNVWRNGTVIGSVAADAAEYVDATPGRNARYHVTALFAEGEGGPSNMAQVANSALDSAERSLLSATANGGVLTVTPQPGVPARVADLAGRVLASGAEPFTLTPPTGVYLVSDGVTTLKISL